MTNTPTSTKRISINRRLFACLDAELKNPPDINGVVYCASDALFQDECGNVHDMLHFEYEHIPLVCPMHQDQRILCETYLDRASSLGFYCKKCAIQYWHISKWEIACVECGIPMPHGSFKNYGICCQCDRSDAASGLDFSKTDVIF